MKRIITFKQYRQLHELDSFDSSGQPNSNTPAQQTGMWKIGDTMKVGKDGPQLSTGSDDFTDKVQLYNKTEKLDAFSWHVPGAELFKLINSPKDCDEDMPVLLYDDQASNKEFVEKLKTDATIYNKPSGILAGKVGIAKKLQKYDWVPKCTFDKGEASKLKFPIIAKANNTYDSMGVEIVDTPEDLQKLSDKFDIFQEGIKIDREFRVVTFVGIKHTERKILMILEKTPKNKKAKDLRIKESLSKEEMKDAGNTKFKWKHHNLDVIKELKGLGEILTKVLDMNPTLNLAGIDVALDNDGKTWFLEHNTKASMLSNQSVLAYKAIYEDFYGKKIADDLAGYADKHYKSSADKYPFEVSDKALYDFDGIAIPNK